MEKIKNDDANDGRLLIPNPNTPRSEFEFVKIADKFREISTVLPAISRSDEDYQHRMLPLLC